MRASVIVFILVVFLYVPQITFAREWVDSTGKFRVNAELVAVRGDNVVLERENGQIVSLPISRLCKADQDFLKQQAATKTPAKGTGSAPQTAPEPSDDQKLAGHALGILKTHCYRCHGEDGADEGGFDFVHDREKLVAAGYLLPKDAARSPLFDRMVSSDSPMPPKGESPRPSADEIDVVRAWIAEGATATSTMPTSEFVTNGLLYRLVSQDLMKLPSEDRGHARYFSTTHLYNLGVSDEELATYMTALAKLLNSLSWNRELAGLHPVSGQPHLFRIDLRDLKWSGKVWQQILDHYPHGLVDASRDALRVRMETSCEVPIVRADWFVASASRPPLYHTLAQIPSTDERLEALLRVDVDENIKAQKVVRLGFARSGVSQNNRLLERHESIFGAYWKSYDFAGNTDRKNLFDHPLGPGKISNSFEHDGGEIIFQLPNGLLAFMLTDAEGRRIDRGPIEIVSDPKQPDRRVVNGVSCMSCHYGGFIQKSDEIRRHVVANVSAYRNTDEILGLYPEDETAKQLIEKDTLGYLQALRSDQIGIDNPTRTGEPIVLIANRYQNELDLKQAAAEMGMGSHALLAELKRLNDTVVDRTFGALKIRGGVIKREIFDKAFLGLAERINLGQRAASTGNAIAKTDQRPLSPERTARPRSSNSTAPRTGNVPAAAQEALRAGIAAIGRGHWQAADDEFRIALRHSANNQVFQARVYEQAIQVYERGEALEPLLTAHQFLLDSCTNTAEIEQAKVNLFNSLFRFARKSSVSWLRQTNVTEIQWGTEPLPTSISNSLAAVFERQLQQTPHHEPALRVMLTYWTRVRNDQSKQFEILKLLDETLAKRDEKIGGMERFNYAHYHATSGDAAKGAELYSEIAREFGGRAAGDARVNEAQAWIRCNEVDKAATALSLAQRHFEGGEVGAAYSLEKIGDLFVSIDRQALAVGAFRAALRLEKSPIQIEKLQQKAAASLSGSSGPMASAGTGSMPADDLLDPRRVYRVKAQQSEQSAMQSPTSAVYQLIQAAESWVQAESPDDATRVLKKATSRLRVESNGGRDYEHKQIAQLYTLLDQPEEAVTHWAEAIKRCKSTHTIAEFQGYVDALLAKHPGMAVAEPLKGYIDPNYGFRMSATELEARPSGDSSSRATNLVQAAGKWSEAGDVQEVRRVGALAVTEIRKISSNSSHHPGERLYATLADSLQKVDLFNEAVYCYLGAIQLAKRDDDAVKYHQQMKRVCEENELSVPVIPQEFAQKLDPLNRYRVSAAEKEQKAKESSSESMQLHYWMQASNDWLKADERELASHAADQHLELLNRKGNVSDNTYRNLAEHYEKIGDDQRAIKTYERALEVSKSDYQKKSLQEKINALR
ncbi:SHD1 domain-containing protein [Stieleria varia]|uniref:Uncharacterized protein n=1 Tax=Stieleria varia TaxID=2528005 RepID=A0A5C6APM4_9BACT|nr:SHD1 domain-containing protein [Stieleria varia]TWU00912.1 hypothetical protein Pla52n_42810 [Stieleria varia]